MLPATLLTDTLCRKYFSIPSLEFGTSAGIQRLLYWPPRREKAKIFIDGAGRSNELLNPAPNVKTFPVSAHETHVNVPNIDAVVFHPVRRRWVGYHDWTSRGIWSKSAPISVSEDDVVVTGVVGAARSSPHSITITLLVSVSEDAVVVTGVVGASRSSPNSTTMTVLVTLCSAPYFGPLLFINVGFPITSMALWLALCKM
jgi:hypothetical protein